MTKIFCLLVLLFSIGVGKALAQTSERVDSAEIHFRQSRTELLLDFEDNRNQLDRIKFMLENNIKSDSLLYIKDIKVVGSASPEGSLKFNRHLSEERAKRIADYLSPGEGLANTLIHSEFTGRNWGG